MPPVNLIRPRANDTAAARLAASWEDAWNRHDMDAAASLVAQDVEFVTVAGLWLRGREEFLSHHRRIHAMQMQDSQWVNLAVSQRVIRDDLVLIHLEWRVTGDREPDGTARPPRLGLFTWLTTPAGDALRILAAHNTNLRSDLCHRMSGSVESASITGGNPWSA
ncbi:SgcJ/EcaC family oxidoreductase [Microvirga aerophila]|uniref:SnoaL-like domain-containing protein n=1 Tax=Microvirga aerophila TaxID=670291 RepID=A0A512C3D8_9HYPH|nr:SgcJ/EcaC family oxidoreductase [Microvirga aerophila]GEO18711.1 hypothetical protein MAE02_64070 [Microvirga aerophila]